MPVTSKAAVHRRRILEDAWIGDAVLCLFARLRILRADGTMDGAKFTRMTSNQFLAIRGESSEVEAAIGRIFEKDGLEAAFNWIEEELMPIFERQEENRRKRLPPKAT